MSPIPTALTALHGHLALTAQRPVDVEASRWLGEAEAIAADLARNQTLDSEVQVERLTQVQALLAEVERIGDPVAAHHVELARRLTKLLVEHLGEKQ